MFLYLVYFSVFFSLNISGENVKNHRENIKNDYIILYDFFKESSKDEKLIYDNYFKELLGNFLKEISLINNKKKEKKTDIEKENKADSEKEKKKSKCETVLESIILDLILKLNEQQCDKLIKVSDKLSNDSKSFVFKNIRCNKFCNQKGRLSVITSDSPKRKIKKKKSESNDKILVDEKFVKKHNLAVKSKENDKSKEVFK